MSKQHSSSDKKWKTFGKSGGSRDGSSFGSGDKSNGKGGFKKFFKGENKGPKSGGEGRSFKKYDDEGGRSSRSSSERSDRRDGDRSFNREDRPYKKSFDGKASSQGAFSRDDKPFKKSFERGDRREGGDRPYNREDRPFKKSFDKGDRREGGDRPYNREDRPFKKSFDKGDRREGSDRSYNREDRPFKKSFDKGDRREGGDRPYNREDRPFKKSFDKGDRREGGDRPCNREDRPFKKSFDKGDRREGGDRPFKKSFDRDDKGKFDKAQKPDRYANTFGKLDDEELAAHQQKMKAKKEEREQGDEVTFSKSIDKWETETKPGQFGSKADRKDFGQEEGGEKRHRHDKKDKFKKQFDNENPYEKAYNAAPDGRPRKKIDLDDDDYDDDEEQENIPGKMPLNKYIAHCDICSRRDAVALIKDGKVKVNGEVIKEPGYKVSDGDEIALNDKKLSVQKNLVYVLLNKPKGYITTTDDPKGRKTVMDIVQTHLDERVFPIGRLDRNTTGLLLLTNDGDLAQKLSHPKYEIRKVYQVTTDKDVALEDFQKILDGITLEDGPVTVDALEYLNAKNEIGLEIHSGKNRIVRRIFESLGYVVEKLDRVMYAGLTKKNVLRGKWRFLTKQEVINLKHFK